MGKRTVTFHITEEDYELAVKLAEKLGIGKGGVSSIAKEFFTLGIQGAIAKGLLDMDEVVKEEEEGEKK